MDPLAAWRARVGPHFNFLLDGGYRLDGGESSAWQTWVQYVSAANAVRVTRSVEFERAEVLLIRLVGGQIPEGGPGWMHNFALLDNLVEVRAPGAARLPGGLEVDRIETQLAALSAYLRSIAADFLAGDCSAIDEVETLLMERKRNNPWPPKGDR